MYILFQPLLKKIIILNSYLSSTDILEHKGKVRVGVRSWGIRDMQVVMKPVIPQGQKNWLKEKEVWEPSLRKHNREGLSKVHGPQVAWSGQGVTRKAIDRGVTDAKRRESTKSQGRGQKLWETMKMECWECLLDLVAERPPVTSVGMVLVEWWDRNAACRGQWRKEDDERSWRWFLQMTLSGTLGKNEVAVAEPRWVSQRGKKKDLFLLWKRVSSYQEKDRI